MIDLKSSCFTLLDSVLDEKSGAYVSGPLDTGRKYYESVAAGKTIDVRGVNEQLMTEFARKLRRQLTHPVVDPGLLRIAGWTGREYGAFFIEVIRRYVREVWFMDGWEFSRGATKEFQYCMQSNVICRDARGAILALNAGRDLIVRAAQYLDSVGVPGDVLRSHLP